MRIIKFLLVSLLAIALVVGAGALVLREALLWWGVSMVQSSLSELQYISQHAKQYNEQCHEKGSISSNEAVQSYRLRFVDNKNYNVEVVCDQFPLDPIIVETKTLPLLVQKLPGSGGIIWGDDRSGAELEIFGRRSVVFVNQRTIASAGGGSNLGSVTPTTTCMGYGYMCCQSESVFGAGQPYSQVNDCPKSCYQACINRPIILSFATDPFPDTAARVISVHAGDSVSFSYVVSVDKTAGLKIMINYGDGQTASFDTINGQSSHTYQCQTNAGGSCQYVANITATDMSGTTSADTPITKMTIQVSP